MVPVDRARALIADTGNGPTIDAEITCAGFNDTAVAGRVAHSDHVFHRFVHWFGFAARHLVMPPSSKRDQK